MALTKWDRPQNDDRAATPRDVEDLRVCNCARCGVELRAAGQEDLVRWLRSLAGGDPIPDLVASRREGRPYCRRCGAAMGLYVSRKAVR
jgi:hypothetical protein